MNKRHYEHTLPNIRGSLSNTYDEQKQKFLDGERITGGMFLEITGRDGFDIHIRTKGTFNRHVRGIDRNGTVSYRKIKGLRTPDFTGCHKAVGDYLAFITTRKGK